MSVKVDTKVWEQIKKNLKQGKDLELSVGYFPEAVYPDGTQVAYIAMLNEEGHRNGPGAVFPDAYTPPRPFMRVGFKESMNSVVRKNWFRESLERIVRGESTFALEYEYSGRLLVKEMQEVIEAWTTPPNSPVTVEIKGFNDPLILTGHMKDSVDFRVEKE